MRDDVSDCQSVVAPVQLTCAIGYLQPCKESLPALKIAAEILYNVSRAYPLPAASSEALPAVIKHQIAVDVPRRARWDATHPRLQACPGLQVQPAHIVSLCEHMCALGVNYWQGMHDVAQVSLIVAQVLQPGLAQRARSVTPSSSASRSAGADADSLHPTVMHTAARILHSVLQLAVPGALTEEKLAPDTQLGDLVRAMLHSGCPVAAWCPELDAPMYALPWLLTLFCRAECPISCAVTCLALCALAGRAGLVGIAMQVMMQQAARMPARVEAMQWYAELQNQALQRVDWYCALRDAAAWATLPHPQARLMVGEMRPAVQPRPQWKHWMYWLRIAAAPAPADPSRLPASVWLRYCVLQLPATAGAHRAGPSIQLPASVLQCLDTYRAAKHGGPGAKRSPAAHSEWPAWAWPAAACAALASVALLWAWSWPKE